MLLLVRGSGPRGQPPGTQKGPEESQGTESLDVGTNIKTRLGFLESCWVHP